MTSPGGEAWGRRADAGSSRSWRGIIRSRITCPSTIACSDVSPPPSVRAPAMRLEAASQSSESARKAAPPNSATDPAGPPQVPSPHAGKRGGGRARVAWYVRRLQCMSPQEVLWRSADALRQRAWRLRQVPIATAPPSLGRLARDGYRAKPKLAKAPRFEAPLPPGALDAVPADDVRRLVRTADEVLAGRWDVLAVTRQDMVAPE